MTKRAYLFLSLYVGSIVLANYVVRRHGVVPVGFGLVGPAAVYVVGVSFTLRDLAHATAGPRWTLAAVLAGAALSWWVASPQIAVASAVAFASSELADMGTYMTLCRRSWLGAVLASNAVGLTVDSIVFLTLAFGGLEFLPGQIVGKAWMTLAALPLLWGARRAFLPRHA